MLRELFYKSGDLAFERIVNTPKRGLGDVAQQKIQAAARQNGVSLVEGAGIAVERGEIKGKGAKGLELLVTQIARWHGQVQAEADTHVELAEMILDGEPSLDVRGLRFERFEEGDVGEPRSLI